RSKEGKLGAAVHYAVQSVALALSLCLGAIAGFAADLPPPSPAYLPPVYNWTGFYIGGNIGAEWSGLSGTNFSHTLGSTFTAPTNVQFLSAAAKWASITSSRTALSSAPRPCSIGFQTAKTPSSRQLIRWFVWLQPILGRRMFVGWPQ